MYVTVFRKLSLPVKDGIIKFTLEVQTACVSKVFTRFEFGVSCEIKNVKHNRSKNFPGIIPYRTVKSQIKQ